MLFNHKRGREVGRKGWGGENGVEWEREGKWQRRTGERKGGNAKPRAE